MYNIYKIKSETTGKIYIGQTSRNILARLAEHKFSSKKRKQSSLHIDIDKFGISDFSIQIIESCEDKFSDEREQYWIAYYDSTNEERGYNKAKGGRGNPGLEVSEETKEKLRLRNKGFSNAAREAKMKSAIGVKVSESVAQKNRERGMKSSKIVQQYSLDMELINEFPSIIEASRATNTDRRTIQRQINGEYVMNGSKRSTSNIKFIWKLK